MAIIRRKIEVPEPSGGYVARLRVESLIRRLVADQRVVVVAATAGAGKTTAVASALGADDRALAWLAVDATDAATGRFLTYLEAALAEICPRAAGSATAAISRRVPHAEAAGLLVESLGSADVTLVLDDLERLGDAPEAWSIVESVARHAPAGFRLVLLTRRWVPGHCSLPATTGLVGEQDLAFTEGEAAAALRRIDADTTEVDAEEAVMRTGGWVTGVLFRAWSSTEHVLGSGGEADPLNGYLSVQIMRQLDEPERELLVTTSLLDDVTAAGAERLGVTDAAQRLERVRETHLPSRWLDGGRVLRHHPRFREFLLQMLERRPVEEVRRVRLAYARLLEERDLWEEATEEYLALGDLENAARSAERPILAIVERMDIEQADRWLDALAPVAAPSASSLTTAGLMVAVAREDHHAGTRLVEALAEADLRDDLARTSDAALTLLVWWYLQAGRIADAEQTLAVATPGPVVEALEYTLGVTRDAHTGVRPVAPLATGHPLDVMVVSATYFMGRFAELEGMASTKGLPWVDAAMLAWRAAALRATGRTTEALALYEQIEGQADVAFASFIGPEVLMDAGRHDDARAALAEGRRRLRSTGSPFFQAINALTEARMVLRFERDGPRAQEILDRVAAAGAVTQLRLVAEILDALRGHAMLLLGDHAGAAEVLQRAVTSLQTGGRLLELPAAAVYLAEARWRCGEEDAADAAADLALDAARRQGSNHLLLLALGDVPAVALRRLDGEAGADSEWHGVARSLALQRPTRGGRAEIELVEFGVRRLLVAGVETRMRIGKAYELLAYLLADGAGEVARQAALADLFPSRDDEAARAYLRQAVRWLRESLPGEHPLEVTDERIRLVPGAVVSSESTRLQAAITEATRHRGRRRLDALLAAVEIAAGGEYLPGRRSGWADDRARLLRDVVTAARFDAAESAFSLSELELTLDLVAKVRTEDPLHEAAWRLEMRAVAAGGDEPRVLRIYQRCAEALADLGTTPSRSTRQLVETLRR